VTKQAVDAPRGATTFKFDPSDLRIIGLDTDDGEEHPLWDPTASEPVSEAFARELDENGQLEPVLFARAGEGEADVVAGRRRVKGIRLVNMWRKDRPSDGSQGPSEPMVVTAILHDGDAKALARAVASENANRKDHSLLEKAASVKRLIEQFGVTLEEAATTFGTTSQTVKNRLALLNTCKVVQQAIVKGEINVTSAVKLAGLSKEDQLSALETLKKEGATSAVAARVARKAKRKKAGGKAAKVETNAYPVPGKRLRRKIVEHEDAANLPDGFLLGIRWANGDIPTSKIGGLTAIVASIEGG